MSGCEARIPAIVDLAEGTLEASARAEIEAHLVGCTGCRDELELLCGATSLLVNTRAEAHPLHLSGLAPRAADAAESFRDRSWRGLWWSTTRGARLALAGSLACLVVAIGVAAWPHEPAPAPKPEPTIATTAQGTTNGETDAESATLDDSLAYENGFDALSAEELETLEGLLD